MKLFTRHSGVIGRLALVALICTWTVRAAPAEDPSTAQVFDQTLPLALTKACELLAQGGSYIPVSCSVMSDPAFVAAVMEAVTKDLANLETEGKDSEQMISAVSAPAPTATASAVATPAIKVTAVATVTASPTPILVSPEKTWGVQKSDGF